MNSNLHIIEYHVLKKHAKGYMVNRNEYYKVKEIFPMGITNSSYCIMTRLFP